MKSTVYCVLFFLVICGIPGGCIKKDDPVPPLPPLKELYKDITIVNWNIEWFGSATRFKGDLDIQQANAAKVLHYLNADLYGLCEITDTARLGNIVRSRLGEAYRYIISGYPVSADAQRLAFVYNRHIFRNVRTRPFLGLSSTAYTSFAGGRFPFLFTADVTVNEKSVPVNFILIHAKADADISSYARRESGSQEMKDSLDLYFAGKHCVIFGDYNDNLDSSILTGKPSPYRNFLNDSARYTMLTYPLNTAGYQSTISYTHSVIDQQMISNTMRNWYVAGSTAIRTDVTSAVPDYITGNTSDHYPVSSVFRF